MKPILIVEDDEHIAKMIAATLSIGGYTSEICEDGERAVTLISERDYDLVLLDVMLPGLDGFSVIQRIQSDKTPVIFLTAVQDVADKVRGLKLGAEDYIVKPFEAVELLARVEVVLRRTNRGKTQICYGDITVNLDEHVVKKGNDPVSLTPKEFDVLVFFCRTPILPCLANGCSQLFGGMNLRARPGRWISMSSRCAGRWGCSGS